PTRRKTREYSWPIIQRIAFELLFRCPQDAHVEAIRAAEEVIDAQQIARPPHFVRSVPQVTCGVKSITAGVSIRGGVALKKSQYAGIDTNFQRIVSIHVVASDTIQV